MVKSTLRKSVDRKEYSNYMSVAENFYSGADVAKEYEYWNASGVLIVHAAIALTDAITIKYGGVKSRGQNHYDSITLLEEVIAASEERKKALNHLRKIIDHKNAVSYSGEVYGSGDIGQLWKWLERFRFWALTVLQ